MTLTKTEFSEFICRGANKLTMRELPKLVAELPDLREQFVKLRVSPHPDTERQLHFLADVVDQGCTGVYSDIPYGALLEAAYAVTYFTRETDLIPDFLGSIGFVDDIAVIQTVLARNADAYAAFCQNTGRNWSELKPRRVSKVYQLLTTSH